MNCQKSRHTQLGLSMLEMFIALAIITTLMLLALPVFTTLAREESARVLHTLAGLVETARSAAIRSGQPVVLCPTDDGVVCTSNWRSGAIVLLGSDARPAAIARWTDLQGDLRWRAFGNRQSLHFDAFGGLSGQNGNFTWCPPPSVTEPAHQLVINSSGRLRFAHDSNGDGLREDSQGRPLRC